MALQQISNFKISSMSFFVKAADNKPLSANRLKASCSV